jgi:hypothetical protein
MAARKHLKAVDGTREAVVVMSVSDAAESGSRLAELRAMRRVIARRIDDETTQARDLAALSKRQMDISKEIEELMAEVEGDELGKAADSPDEGFDPKAV